MKITLDISKLVEAGTLTHDEADRITTLAARDTGLLGLNIVIGFGVFAVIAGAMALVPTPLTAFGLGLALSTVGLTIVLTRVRQWVVLGQICLVVGALLFAGGVIAHGHASLASMLIVVIAFALTAVAAKSAILMAMSVLVASACLGAHNGYRHALYSLTIVEPTLTIMLFSAVSLIAYAASKVLPAHDERLAITAARTSLFLVNAGFWIGSLWGDPLLLLGSQDARSLAVSAGITGISATTFTILWAFALLSAGTWAILVGRRWVVNLVAVFGGIHFYTQWFESLGATPLSVLIGGAVMLAGAVALSAWGQQRADREPR